MTRSNLFIAEMFRGQGCLNIEQGVNLWHMLNHVLWSDIKGQIVELGCLSGRTAVVMGKTIEDAQSNKDLYLYDSFQGLPQPTKEDFGTPVDPAAFRTTEEEVRSHFKEMGVPMPFIIPGWFKDTLPTRLPLDIAFVHLDVDFYEPIKEALEAIYPRLSRGAIVVIDDYHDASLAAPIKSAYDGNPYQRAIAPVPLMQNHFPGVQQGVEEFLADKSEAVTVMLAAHEKHCFFRKA